MDAHTEVRTPYGDFREGLRLMREHGLNAPGYNVLGPNDLVEIYFDQRTDFRGTQEQILAERKLRGIEIPYLKPRTLGLFAGRGLETIKLASRTLDAGELEQGLRDVCVAGHPSSRIVRNLVKQYISNAEGKGLDHAATQARKISGRFNVDLGTSLSKK